MKYFTKALLTSTLIVGGGLMLTNIPAQAHHSFSATFQENATITVEGVVNNFSFKNPHILIYFDVANDDGTTTEWVVEGGAATLFRRSGWSASTLKGGEYIRVTGDSTHDGSPMVSMQEVLVLNAETKDVIESLVMRRNGATDDSAEDDDDGRQRRGGNEYPRYDIATTLPNGLPNLSAPWASTVGGRGPGGAGAERVLTPAGEKKQAAFVLAEDTQVFCDPPGAVRQAGMTPHPFEVIQHDDRIVINYEEYGGTREIALGKSRADLIDSGVKTHLGDSIAYYEGDTLVIETINLIENYSTPAGTTVSDQATAIERLKRADNDTNGAVLSYEMIVDDPVYFAEPLVFTKTKAAVEGYEMIENDCQAPLRDRNMAHPQTSFFLTSVGLGDGANLGGLDGADAHCNALASSVNVGDRGWRAFLSTTGEGGVNAIDRIGQGPWYNSRGVLVARDKAELIAATGLTKESVLSEGSLMISGREDDVNRHDILTGTQNDGTALNNGEDTTCSNWTSNGVGSALAGHHDRIGGGADPTSWTHAHGTRGCSQENLQGTGGDGLFYCFASVQTTSESRVDSLVPAPPGAGARERGARGDRGDAGRNGQGGMGAAGGQDANARPADASAPAAPRAPQGADTSEGGSLTWLWVLLGALILGGIGFMASRKKS